MNYLKRGQKLCSIVNLMRKCKLGWYVHMFDNNSRNAKLWVVEPWERKYPDCLIFVKRNIQEIRMKTKQVYPTFR